MEQPSLQSSFDQAFWLSPIPQLIIDSRNQTCLGWNQGFEQEYGKPEVGQLWPTLLRWADAIALEEILENVVKDDYFECPQVFIFDEEEGKKEIEISCSGLGESSENLGHRVLSFRENSNRNQETILLQSILQASASRIGRDYFDYCTETLCHAFDMDLGVISRLEPTQDRLPLRTTSIFSLTEGHLEEKRYQLSTSCAEPIYLTKEPVRIKNNLSKRYPKETFLEYLNFESFLGFPILGATGHVVGHLSLYSKSKRKQHSEIEEIFLHIFSSRIEAEVRRLDIESQLEAAKEEAIDASHSKTRFLAHISHELRTPLNAVLGYAQLLAEKPSLSPEDRNMVSDINRNGTHLMKLINDVLDMSQIEIGRIDIDLQDTNLAELNEDLGAVFNQTARQHPGGLTVDFDPNLPGIIRTDRGKLRQILINILSNAFKYSKGAPIHYSATFQRVAGAHPNIVFKVIDYGPGIPEDVQEKLFQPFERADNRTNAETSGSGLGLSIAREFSRAMKGELMVESTLGESTCFTLILPVPQVVKKSKDSSWVTVKARKELIGGTVLIVDDTDASRDIARQLLESRDFVVLEASDGREGADICLLERPDIVLMDIRMPIMDGIEASKLIRESLRSQSPPIIGLTGDILKIRDNFADEGLFDDIVSKPFQFETLLNAIRVQLVRKQKSA